MSVCTSAVSIFIFAYYIYMITAQAREKTLLAIKLLKEEQLREKKLADYYDAVTKDLYQQEGSDQYPQAEALMVSLLSHYRGIEKRRLDALAKKELTRKANTPSDLANALCREPENYPVPSTSRVPRAPTKRARPGKSQSPAREVKKPTAAASSSKGRQAHGYTATKGRSKSPKASTSKQQAKGKSSQNASKGKGKAQAKGKSTKAAPPKKELSEGTLMVLEALGELTKQLTCTRITLCLHHPIGCKNFCACTYPAADAGPAILIFIVWKYFI